MVNGAFKGSFSLVTFGGGQGLVKSGKNFFEAMVTSKFGIKGGLRECCQVEINIRGKMHRRRRKKRKKRKTDRKPCGINTMLHQPINTSKQMYMKMAQNIGLI